MARAVDVAVTRVQEWLEEPDRPGALVVGYGVIAVAAVVMVGQLVRMFI